MIKKNTQTERLSIDVLPEEHRQIKIYAAMQGKTIREYVLESIRERLRSESADQKELRELSELTTSWGPVFKEVWNNEKDAEYDEV